MDLKLTINDPKTGKSYKKEITNGGDFLLHKKIGEKVSGDHFGMKGYELVIAGGSDAQGFPMRRDVEGGLRKRPLVVSGVGFNKKNRGQQQRKTVASNLIHENSRQINLKIETVGKDSIETALGIEVKEEPKAEESPKEEVKEVPAEEKTE